MTVCIAARAATFLVLISDRMLTAGDIQFEPSRQKMVSLTNSIVVLTAGDASQTTKVLTGLNNRVAKAVADQPEVWLEVGQVTRWYVEEYDKVRSWEAERAILAPLGLTTEQFLDRQGGFDSDFVWRITSSLLDHEVPDCEVIIAGRDPTGTYIYTVTGNEVDQHDTIGFAAIGSGSRHALAHLMQVRHTWNASLNDALVRAYVAKRRAEAAPGVGRATDIVVIGEQLGINVLVGDAVIARLDDEYERMIQAERVAEQAAREAIDAFVRDAGAREAEPQRAEQEK